MLWPDVRSVGPATSEPAGVTIRSAISWEPRRSSWNPTRKFVPSVAARATLERARNASANGTYYTASSVSFQASIEFHYVREAGELLASSERDAALVDTITEAGRTVERARRAIEATPVRDTS